MTTIIPLMVCTAFGAHGMVTNDVLDDDDHALIFDNPFGSTMDGDDDDDL